MPVDHEAFERAIAEHDDRVAGRGTAVWMGAEPTFTDRFSEAPEWLTQARGADKEARARNMLAELSETLGQGVVLRTLGRQYAGEERPRWSLGFYSPRQGTYRWPGPVDPLLGGTACHPGALEDFWLALTGRLNGDGWAAAGFRVQGAMDLRIAFRCDGLVPAIDATGELRLARTSPHDRPIPLEGLSDDLAREGTYLVAIGCNSPAAPGEVACVEMPAFAEVALFQRFVQIVGEAAAAVALPGLALTGFPPPVDETVAWTTLTPDPAVVEVNMAPAPDAATFLAWTRRIFAAAGAQGLAPYRLHYNGTTSDSGGGGHITLGGPRPQDSPFFLAPHLLPNLLGYFNRHPSLSYWFSRQSIGSSSQSPRPDEKVREAVDELGLALDLLARIPRPGPETIWGSLAPFLCDSSGNTHRSELNVEKLWNPYLPNRGRLGLVEFRPFHMSPSPEALTALACLIRALAVMLAAAPSPVPLVDWGPLLHDRYALPFYLRRDLREVLADLDGAGLGLGAPIREVLLNEDHRLLGQATLGACRVELRRALEPWPLVGDAASQEQGTSRLVDSSTSRVELTVRADSGDPGDLRDLGLIVDGYRVPWKTDEDSEGPVLLRGFRYRAFVPWQGLHPTLGAHGPLAVTLVRRATADAMRLTVHEWRPDGGAYDGLPADLPEAHRRVAERVVMERLDRAQLGQEPPPPRAALTEHCLDLRRL